MINLADVAKKVGLATLFFALWAISALGFNILLLMFFGIVSVPMAGFGLIQSPPPATFADMNQATFVVYVVTSALAVTVGGYFSAMVTAHRGNSEVLDIRVKYIGYAVVWMTYTWIYALGLLFLVVVTFGFAQDSYQMGSTTDFHSILREARYFLFAVVVAAGVFAGLELQEKQVS